MIGCNYFLNGYAGRIHWRRLKTFWLGTSTVLRHDNTSKLPAIESVLELVSFFEPNFHILCDNFLQLHYSPDKPMLCTHIGLEYVSGSFDLA